MTLCHQVCRVRILIDIRQVSFASSPTTSCRNMHFNITCFNRPNPRLDAHAFADRLSIWFTRVASCPSSFKWCVVTIPSATPVVRAYNSAAAKLQLTDCCVLEHAERVALLHCVTPPLVLLHVKCCPAQSQSVCTFTNCRNVLILIKHFALQTPFKYRAMRFNVHLVASSGTEDPCCFFPSRCT